MNFNDALASNYLLGGSEDHRIEDAIRNELVRNFERMLLEQSGYNPTTKVLVPRDLWNRMQQQWAADRAEMSAQYTEILQLREELSKIKGDKYATDRDSEGSYFCPQLGCERNTKPFAQRNARSNHAKTHERSA